MNVKIATAVGATIVGLAVSQSGGEAHAAAVNDTTDAGRLGPLVSKVDTSATDKAVNAKKQELTKVESETRQASIKHTQAQSAANAKSAQIAKVDSEIKDATGKLPPEAKLQELKQQKGVAEIKRERAETLLRREKDDRQSTLNSLMITNNAVNENIKTRDDAWRKVEAARGSGVKLQEAQIKVKKLADKEVQARSEVNRLADNLARAERSEKEHKEQVANLTQEKKTEEANLTKLQGDLAKAEKAYEANAKATSNNYFKEPYVETKIQLDSRFVSALKNYLANNSQANLQKVIDVEKSLNLRAQYPKYANGQQYVHGIEKVDPEHLTEDQKLRLSQYFTMINNQVRAQFGKAPQHVNLNVQKFVDKIVEKTNADKFSKYEHYHRAINKAAYEIGIDKYDHGTVYNRFESLDFLPNLSKTGTTMKDLYDRIYISVQRFYLEGRSNGHYEHARHLLSDADVTAVGLSAFIKPEDAKRQSATARLSVVSVNKLYMHDGWRYVGYKPVANYDRYEALFGSASGKNVTPITPDRVNMSSVDEAGLRKINAEINLAKRQITATKTRITAIEKELNTPFTSNADRYRAVLEEKKRDLVKAQDALKQAHKEFEDAAREKGAFDGLQRKLNEAQVTLDKAKAKHKKLSEDLLEQNATIDKLEKESTLLEATLRDINRQIVDETEKLKYGKPDTSALGKERERLVKELAMLNEDVAKAQAELDKMYAKESKVRNELRELEIEARAKATYHATTRRAPILTLPEFDLSTLDEVKPAPVAEVKPEVKPAPVAEVKPDVKDEPKVEVNPDVKDEPIVEVKPEVKSDVAQSDLTKKVKETLDKATNDTKQGKITKRANVDYSGVSNKPGVIQANTKVNKELPYTGDEGSYAGVGMLLGLLGFLGIKKRA